MNYSFFYLGPLIITAYILTGCEDNNSKSATPTQVRNYDSGAAKTNAAIEQNIDNKDPVADPNSNKTDPVVDPSKDLGELNPGNKTPEASTAASLFEPKGDPTKIEYVPKERFGAYLSQVQNEFGQDIKLSSCAGDAFLAGEKSTMDDKDTGDREMQFYCQFWKDGQGRPVRKRNCSVPKDYTNPSKDFKYQCPDKKVLSGVQSIYNPAEKSRSYRHICCDMETEDGRTVTLQDDNKGGEDGKSPTCTNLVSKEAPFLGQEVNANSEVNSGGARGPVDFTCAKSIYLDRGDGLYNPILAPSGQNSPVIPMTNSALMEITSDFKPEYYDRIMSFKCCHLKAPAPAGTKKPVAE